MAETYNPFESWLLPLPTTTGSSSGGSGATCPILPLREVRGIQEVTQIPGWTPVSPGSIPRTPPQNCLPSGLTGFATDMDDFLRFSILVTNGPKTVTFYGSRVAPNGELLRFSQDVTGNSSSTPATATLMAGPGIIQGVGATAVGGIGSATIYVLAEIGDMVGSTFTPRAQIFSGLLTSYGIAQSTSSAGSGGGGVNSNCGTQNSVFPSGSVANWQETITVGASTISRLIGAYWTATTSPVAANRSMTVFLNNGLDDVWTWWDPVLMPASTTKNFFISCNAPYQQSTLGTGTIRVNVPSPDCIFFNSEWYFTVAYNNVQVGDTISNRSLTYQEQAC